MPLFSIQNKNMSKTLILIITLVYTLHCAVAIVYAIRVDKALYDDYPKMSNEEMRKICVYVFFWLFFFVKLEKIIKGKR